MNPETNDTNETTPEWSVTLPDVGDLCPLRVSGAVNTLYLRPSLETGGPAEVYLFSNVGSGTPERAWNGREYAIASIPADATPEGIRERLESIAAHDLMREIDNAYQGTRWNGSNMIGQWAWADDDGPNMSWRCDEVFANLPTYWNASDWYAPLGEHELFESVDKEGATLDEIVTNEVDAAALNDAALEPGDVEKTLKWFAEKWLDKHDDESDDERDEKVRAIALRWLGRPAPFTLTPARRKEILLIEWGEIEEFFAEDEIESRREAWESAEASWNAAILELLAAKDRESAIAALKTASSTESEWGDDPSTQRVARIAGLEDWKG